MAPCQTCPHRKTHEGGNIPDDKVPITNMVVAGREVKELHGSVIHPCHEHAMSPCRGHIRDLQELATGKSTVDYFNSVTFQVGKD